MTATSIRPELANVAELFGLEEFELLAVAQMPDAVRVLIQGGAGDGQIVQANVDAWKRWSVRQRALVDVVSCDTSTTVLGEHLSVPIMIAPSGMHGLVHPDGEVATAQAATKAGVLMVLSMAASRTPEEVGAEASSFWMQMYWGQDRGLVKEVVERAQAAGASALCLTVDLPVKPFLNAEMRRAQAALKNEPTPLMPRQFHGGDRLGWNHDPRLTWSDLEWLASLSPLPIVLKGITNGADARHAIDAGARGIIVSNHGGRSLAHGVTTAAVLPEVVEEADGQIEVLVDGGIRSGADVLRAVALGARSVLVGRPPLWGLKLGGAAGAARVIELLREELEITMAMAGASTLADIGPGMLAPPSPAPAP